MQYIILLVLLAILSGCQPPPDPADVKFETDFLGQNLKDIIKIWGKPTEVSLEINEGVITQVYSYTAYYCNVHLYVDEDKKVTKVFTQGDCYPKQRKY